MICKKNRKGKRNKSKNFNKNLKVMTKEFSNLIRMKQNFKLDLNN